MHLYSEPYLPLNTIRWSRTNVVQIYCLKKNENWTPEWKKESVEWVCWIDQSSGAEDTSPASEETSSKAAVFVEVKQLKVAWSFLSTGFSSEQRREVSRHFKDQNRAAKTGQSGCSTKVVFNLTDLFMHSFIYFC